MRNSESVMTNKPEPSASGRAVQCCSRMVFLPALFSVLTPILTMAASPAGPAAKPAAAIDFGREIRPILSNRCFKCHGPGQAEAGLRLDDRKRAIAKLESGAVAIQPGKHLDSELIRRITADDDERMPPVK